MFFDLAVFLFAFFADGELIPALPNEIYVQTNGFFASMFLIIVRCLFFTQSDSEPFQMYIHVKAEK
jgi:hypothetical protein